MRDIRNVKYSRTYKFSEDFLNELIKQNPNIDINYFIFPSVEVISYSDFLSKDVDNRIKNDGVFIRTLTENIAVDTTISAKDMIDMMYRITNALTNNQQIDIFDLYFCEQLLNPIIFSCSNLDQHRDTSNGGWYDCLVFCLNDRLSSDMCYVCGNEPFYFWNGSQAVVFENINDLRNSIKDLFKKISTEDTFDKFKAIYPKFKSIAGKYLVEHKEELYDDGIITTENLLPPQIDYIKNKKQYEIKCDEDEFIK